MLLWAFFGIFVLNFDSKKQKECWHTLIPTLSKLQNSKPQRSEKLYGFIIITKEEIVNRFILLIYLFEQLMYTTIQNRQYFI